MDKPNKPISEAAAKRMRDQTLGLEPTTAGVGYKSPPEEHRFKKGRSGNPKGRPKKKLPPSNASLTWDQSLAAIQDKKRQVTIDGVQQSLSAREIVLMKQVQNAMKGEYASARLLERAALREESKRIQKIAEDQAYWREYVDNFQKLRAGIESDEDYEWMPRPDEIYFPSDDFVKIDAATSKAEWKNQIVIREYRDAFFMEHIWESMTLDSSATRSKSIWLLILFNSTLVKRLRWSKKEMDKQLSEAFFFRMQDVRIQRSERWAKAGVKITSKWSLGDVSEKAIKTLGMIDVVRDIEGRERSSALPRYLAKGA